MKCSVCIPTFNAEPYIGKLGRSYIEQSISCEVIVVDSSSADDTVNIAKSYGTKSIA